MNIDHASPNLEVDLLMMILYVINLTMYFVIHYLEF